MPIDNTMILVEFSKNPTVSVLGTKVESTCRDELSEEANERVNNALTFFNTLLSHKKTEALPPEAEELYHQRL